jgi:hypothetical protein
LGSLKVAGAGTVAGEYLSAMLVQMDERGF